MLRGQTSESYRWFRVLWYYWNYSRVFAYPTAHSTWKRVLNVLCTTFSVSILHSYYLLLCMRARQYLSGRMSERLRVLAGRAIHQTYSCALSLSLSLFPSKTRPPDEPFSMLDFFWLNSSGSETLGVLRYYRKSMFNTWLKGNSRWVNTCAGYVPTGNAPPCKQKVFIYPEITILPEEITVLYGHEPLCHGFMPPFLSMAAPDEPWMDTRSTNEETAAESSREWGRELGMGP